MAITFVANSSNNAYASSADVTAVLAPGTAVDDLMLCCFCFGSVAAGSGPWVATAPAGWLRIIYQAPSATGTGIEVWGAIYVSGVSAHFTFNGTYQGNMRESTYRGFAPIVPGQIVSLVGDAKSDVWTGNNPVAPSVNVDVNGSMVGVCAADTLSSTGFGYPAPYTKRWDNAEGGIFGHPEDALGEHIGAAIGATGTIGLTAPVTPAGAKGTTCTFVIRITGVIPSSDFLPMLGVS